MDVQDIGQKIPIMPWLRSVVGWAECQKSRRERIAYHYPNPSYPDKGRRLGRGTKPNMMDVQLGKAQSVTQ
jgi:hypothetical protein